MRGIRTGGAEGTARTLGEWLSIEERNRIFAFPFCEFTDADVFALDRDITSRF